MRAEQHSWVLVEPVALREGLGVGHVQGCPTHSSFVEGSSEGFLVDQGPAGHVDQMDSRLGGVQKVVVDQVVGGRGEWCGQY